VKVRLIDHVTFRDQGANDCMILLDGRIVKSVQVAKAGEPGYVVVVGVHPAVPGLVVTELLWGTVQIHPDWRVYLQDRPDTPFFDFDRHLSGLPQLALPALAPVKAPEAAPTVSIEVGGDIPNLSLRPSAPAGPDRSLDRWRWRVIRRGGLLPVTQDDPHPTDPTREISSDPVLLPRYGGDPALVAAVVLEPQQPGEPRVILEVRPGEQPRRFNRRYLDGSGQAVGTCWVLALEKNGVEFYAFFRPDGTVVLSTDNNASECGFGMKDAMMRGTVKIGDDPITWNAAMHDFTVSVELGAVE
jgi:hypothetical protein